MTTGMSQWYRGIPVANALHPKLLKSTPVSGLITSPCLHLFANVSLCDKDPQSLSGISVLEGKTDSHRVTFLTKSFHGMTLNPALLVY